MSARNYTPINDLIQKWKKPPVSLPKEAEPIPRTPEVALFQEVVEHEPSPEVKPFVKLKPETISLPPDLTTLGLQPVKSTQFPTYKNIKLPLSDEKVIQGLQAPVSSSKRWLSEFAVYLLKRAHLSLKQIGGRVVRVIRL